MRLTFLALLVTKFVVACVGFTSAESDFLVKNDDNGFRGLSESAYVQEERGGGDAIAKAIAGGGDDVAKVIAGGGDDVAKLSKAVKDAFTVGDDEVAKALILVKKANGGEGVGLADDDLGKIAKAVATAQKSSKLTDEQASMLSKAMIDWKKATEAAKVDDEVAKMSAMFKKANVKATGAAKYTDDELVAMAKAFSDVQKTTGFSDNQMANLAKLFTNAKQATSSTDASVAKLSQELAGVVQKDKKSWSTLKKVIVGTLGVTIGGAVIYGTVKLVSKDSSSPATTTTGSA